MATEKFINGATAGWASAFGTEINSLVNGNSILSSVAVANGTNLDMFCDISFVAGGTITTVQPPILLFYIYPLCEDGSTYGDGRYTTSAASGSALPAYYALNMPLVAAAGTTMTGVNIKPIILPPGDFKFVLSNAAGANLPSSNTCKYRTYNRRLA